MKHETYYAIRIGDPRRHVPYFMISDKAAVPVLFVTRQKAEEAARDEVDWRTPHKVVRVKIKAG